MGATGSRSERSPVTLLNGEPIDQPSVEVVSSAQPTASSESQSVGTVAGLVSLILAFVFPIAGIVVGAIALNQAKQGGYRNSLAKAGFILGIVLTVLVVVVVVVGTILSVTVFSDLFRICAELGDGVHHVNGVTYRCNV
jgi:heme/copper-type cytochrome/quinol oxidase subunit 2